MMKVKIKRLTETAVIPTRGTEFSAGWDLTADSMKIENGIITYGTGIAIEIPEGYFGAIFMRSSVCKMGIGFSLKNAVGIIDSDYRGEILFKFERGLFIDIETFNDKSFHTDIISYPKSFVKNDNEYQVGDRIGQLIILPYPQIEFEEVSELTTTERGEGGFGSTNKASDTLIH
jgi:dUTP pyrophosphatase